MTPVPPDILEEAIAILGSEQITNEGIESKVAALVSDSMTARRLIDWIPEAFGIVLVSHMAKVVLPTKFSAKSSNGRWEDFKFEREPIFTSSIIAAQHIYHNGPRYLFQNIAVRSSTFKCANQLLNAGESLEGAAVGGPALIGIPAEVYHEKSTSFWRKLFS
jgi:hypothetical protein